MDKTKAKRQAERTQLLDQIAQRAGWHSWSVYERHVKNGIVGIQRNPNPNERAVTKRGKK